MKIEKGTVYWITGLAGAGKTSIANLLYSCIKKNKNNVVLLDGDQVRNALGIIDEYELLQREKIAMMYSRFCKLLSDQGIDVICATISMFNNCRAWNKKNISNYEEIYIKVPFEVLEKRNQKKLYSIKKNVVGFDVKFEEPINPSIILHNDGTLSVKRLFQDLCEKLS